MLDLRAVVLGSFVLGGFVLMAAPSSALAQSVVAGPPRVAVPVLRSGKVAQSRGLDVRVLGTQTMKVGDLADAAFKDTRARNAGLSSVTASLLAAPVSDEKFTETDATITLESSVSITIIDPDKFRRGAPTSFKTLNVGMRDRAGFSVSQLKPDQKNRFDSFKAELALKPANHPLRVALQGGDNALLDAIARGQGDVTVTTKVVVPKNEIKMQGSTPLMPKFVGGSFDYAQVEPVPYKAIKPMTVTPNAPSPPTVSSGTATQVTKFLTGFTKSDSFDWEERWDLGTHDYFAIGAHVGYGLGLRVPVEVTATMDPMTTTTTATRDRDSDYNVKLTAKTLDASTSYYTDAGLSTSDASEGKEFVLEAHAYVSIDVVAGWGFIDIHQTIPSTTGFDFGQQFTPPFGSCGTSCGFDVWIPSIATRTQISILGVVSGAAQIGFNVSGNGVIGVDYTSRSGGNDVPSRLPNEVAITTNHLTFDGLGANQKSVTTTLPAAIGSISKSTDFGYKLSNPSYAWTLVATPGVKGTVSVNAKPFFSLEEVLGPYWLNAFALKLGTVTLKTHEGTRNAYFVTTGSKTFNAPGGALKPTATSATIQKK